MSFEGKGSRSLGDRVCHKSTLFAGQGLSFALDKMDMNLDNSSVPSLLDIHCNPWGENRENPDDAPGKLVYIHMDQLVQQRERGTQKSRSASLGNQ